MQKALTDVFTWPAEQPELKPFVEFLATTTRSIVR